MVSPTDRNRLADEASPYLRAHADNPVNWQPWDDTALQAAREHDVPIFLSIGYSACHWCHVMAEESFEDPAVASRLNGDFVPIKVDREERPELDDIYMTVCRLVRGGGCGWPLSAWLTPDGKPFFIGTYFPKDSRGNQRGFLDVIDTIEEQWNTQREELEDRASQWMDSARGHLEETPTALETLPESDLVSRGSSALLARADRQYGGFGRGQKFPQPGKLRLLAMSAAQNEDSDSHTVFVETLDAMANGGLRDHLGGGFHRYCTDRSWTVPHFEKMLYDNAEIPRAFLDGYRVTGEERYAAIAAETMDFIERELRHPDGGLYSSLDARNQSSDSDESTTPNEHDVEGRGVEGAFYVWTPDTVRSAIESGIDEDDPDEIDRLTSIVCDRYGIDEAGNFEGETVLTISESIESLAQRYETSQTTIESAIDTATEYLILARENRPRPPRDEKVIAAWNGLAIGAMAEASMVLDEPRYARLAEDAVEFVRNKLWDGNSLSRRWAPTTTDSSHGDPEAGDVKGNGYLDDYAFLARGALQLHGATGRVEALAFALDLGHAMREDFWDAEAGTLYYTPDSASGVPVRSQDIDDQSTPSSTGVAVSVLQTLSAFDPDAGFEDVAKDVLRTHSGRIESNPEQHPTLVEALDRHRRGSIEVTISASSRPEWIDDVTAQFVPDLLLTQRPPTEEGLESWLETLDLQKAPPIWAGRTASSGPTAYVCRRSCSPPLSDPAEIMSWIRDFQGDDGELKL